MTLKDAILTAAQTLPAVAAGLTARNPVAIAAAMPSSTVLKKTEVGAGTIISVMGVGAGGGGEFLSKLRSSTLPSGATAYASDIAEMLPVIDRGGLDLGNSTTRTFVAMLQSVGMLTTEQSAALLALGQNSVPITEYDVRCAMWAADGTWLGG